MTTPRRFTLALSLLLATASLADEKADKATDKTFRIKCGQCHGKDGKGQTKKGAPMGMRDMASADFQAGSDDDWRKAIVDGFKREKDGKPQEMDGFREELDDAQVDALIRYVRALKK